MISTILRIEWLNLKRDYVALGLSFVLPVIFFSISALIFGGSGFEESAGPRIQVLSVDRDGTPLSRSFLRALGEDPAIELTEGVASENGLEEARRSIFEGRQAAALIVPPGFGESLGAPPGKAVPIKILYDASNPLAKEMLAGVIQSAALTSGWNRFMLRWLEDRASPSRIENDAERAAVQRWMDGLRGGTAASTDPGELGPLSGEQLLVPVDPEDVRGEQVDVISYSAAGIGVMFLLFSMSGAGGSILEEVETGTLERILNSAVGLGRLLLAKWAFFTCFAVVQLTVMFVWGAIFFGVDLGTPKRLAGFLLMTCVTAGAAASFGIFLATVCRTRSQLGGVSTILILVMSALGGSMVPRFLMPDFMKYTSRLTFNGWALDGYLKVFWYGDPQASLLASLAALAPQVGVLGAMTVVLLTLAYFLSRRWLSL